MSENLTKQTSGSGPVRRYRAKAGLDDREVTCPGRAEA